MTVYIEYVLFDNLFIDYSLLKATFLIKGMPVRKCRLFLSAFFGSVIALIFPLLNFNLLFVGLIKLFSGALIVFFANSYKRIKDLYICCVIFLLLTFALGGIIIGCFLIFDIDYSSEFSIAIMFLPAKCFIQLLISFFNYLYKKGKMKNSNCQCEIYNGEKHCKIMGLVDSGNGLSFNGKPVAVMGKKDALKIMQIKDFNEYNTIEYLTASGKGNMKIFYVEKIVVDYENKKHEIFGVLCGIGKITCGQIILSPMIFNGGEQYE